MNRKMLLQRNAIDFTSLVASSLCEKDSSGAMLDNPAMIENVIIVYPNYPVRKLWRYPLQSKVLPQGLPL